MNNLSTVDVTKIYDKSTREFSNNISTVGHNYLKHHFKSYWNSKFNGNLSPVEAWLDDKIMQEVINYRIGCNNSGEVYDFSLHQLVRGLSARRITISFFKPMLAAAIYKHYLGDMESPIVLDPCCGFGGRLLGFTSTYPDGIYIGCEPNVDTYGELIKLKQDAGWSDGHVRLYNCKFEDFADSNYNYDLVFTSIPYYDREIYSNRIVYNSFDQWKHTFIKAIEKRAGNNCYINVPEELAKILGWSNIDSYIRSNRSHFDKREGCKREQIVQL
jgi:tRNA G46 methylase TrmB